MREWINLLESNTPFVLDDAFATAVHEYLEEHLADWADDFPDLKNDLQVMWDRIASAGIDGDRIEVYREELRPRDQIEDHNYGTLGACWSWDYSGARTCHHDNAYDEYGRDNVEEVMFTATVALSDVDWVQTMAKNLVLKNEREINIRDGATVHVEEVSMPKDPGHMPSGEFEIDISNMSDF